MLFKICRIFLTSFPVLSKELDLADVYVIYIYTMPFPIPFFFLVLLSSKLEKYSPLSLLWGGIGNTIFVSYPTKFMFG